MSGYQPPHEVVAKVPDHVKACIKGQPTPPPPPVPRRTDRPSGQPGTVHTKHTVRRDSWGEKFRTGLSYPAVQLASGVVVFWRDTLDSAGKWIVAPGRLAESFEAGPEWQADCPHQHALPWQTCDSESDCTSLLREDERTWGP